MPLHLSYRIFESSPKRLKLTEDNENFKQSLTNAGISSLDPRVENPVQQQQQSHQPPQQSDPGAQRESKEVQLKISETGIMTVTNITSPESKKNSPKSDKKLPPLATPSTTTTTTATRSQQSFGNGNRVER